eukprot:153425-Chlamydomonas_euryale.AAC.1
MIRRGVNCKRGGEGDVLHAAFAPCKRKAFGVANSLKRKGRLATRSRRRTPVTCTSCCRCV